MGGAVSAGQNNDELVDNLCHEDYIQTPEVEMVFRQVDRANFMKFQEDGDISEAYEDHAWRRGTLHLSAPCIYTRAMEALRFKRGVSFLNVGSGTGYFSTMAGLLIGPYGINHGIEIYPENIEFAQEKLAEFYEKFPWYDPMKFCEPLFVEGNGLLLSPGNLLYSRIYCGAACPPEHAQLMKNMLAVGGILVMPHDNQLECVDRVSQTEWKTEVILPSVSFAPLILPSQESVKDLAALEIAIQPFTLKHYCRLEILKQLGRERYHKASELPLPQHLKDYVAHYRDWGPSSPPVKILCPIDHSKEKLDQSSSEDGQAKAEAAASGDGDSGSGSNGYRKGGARESGDGRMQYAHPMNINGRRMLICNINGIYFQIPLENDDRNENDDNDEEMTENSASEENSSMDNNASDENHNELAMNEMVSQDECTYSTDDPTSDKECLEEHNEEQSVSKH